MSGNILNSNSLTTIPRFFAADVGGTHVRLGLVDIDLTQSLPVKLSEYLVYRCANYPCLGDIIAEFLQQTGQTSVQHGVIASAGFALENGTVVTANLPWTLSLEKIRQQLNLQQLVLVNDFEALAHAAAYIDQQDVQHLAGPSEGVKNAPRLMVGAGTGLGAAVWIPQTNGDAVVLPTEAGHASLAAYSDIEIEILKFLRQNEKQSHLRTEHILSGPGLFNIYLALSHINNKAPVFTVPAEVSNAAIQGSDQLAKQSLDIFCAWLGSIIGDMALLYSVQGGIYLAGGVLPQMGEYILTSDFSTRLINKGAVTEIVKQVPIKLVEHGQLGVIGAATWYLNKYLK